MSSIKDTVEALIMVLEKKLLTEDEAKDAAKRIFAVNKVEETENNVVTK